MLGKCQSCATSFHTSSCFLLKILQWRCYYLQLTDEDKKALRNEGQGHGTCDVEFRLVPGS